MLHPREPNAHRTLPYLSRLQSCYVYIRPCLSLDIGAAVYPTRNLRPGRIAKSHEGLGTIVLAAAANMRSLSAVTMGRDPACTSLV